MPGFAIGGSGGGPSSGFKAKYSYTWEIKQLFGTSANDGPLIFARDASLPTFAVKEEAVLGTSVQYKYASEIMWENCKVSFYDTDGLVDILKKWRKSIWNPEDGLGIAHGGSGYKKTSIIQEFFEDWSESTTWELHNSWPSIIRYGELTYTNSDSKFVDVTITYDWATEDAEGESYVTDSIERRLDNFNPDSFTGDTLPATGGPGIEA